MDFGRLLHQAEQEELLTAPEREERERKRAAELQQTAEANRVRANREAAAGLRQVWFAVQKSLLTQQPLHDLMVLDVLRLAELPTRMPERRGWGQARRVAKWKKAADRIAIPAWDMLATFRIASYHGETYRPVPYEMYFGSNGVVYLDPKMPESSGTCAGWEASFSSAEEVGNLPREGTGPRREAVDGRGEIAIGFARLVVKHRLLIDAVE